MITRELRRALRGALAAAGFPADADPGLRPAGAPGRYAASVALTLGADPRAAAASLAGTLARADWISAAEVTGPGYLTVTVTPAALAAVADEVTSAGPGCVASDALSGLTVPAGPAGDPLAAATWEEARAALAARLTARLAAAAGATVADPSAAERVPLTLPAPAAAPGAWTPAAGTAPRDRAGEDPGSGASPSRLGGQEAGPRAAGPAGASAGGGEGTPLWAATAFAGRDAVTFTLARAIPGKPLRVDPRIIARHLPGNPAYAVRYAHARAASGVRWAAASSAADTICSAEAPRSPLAGPQPELVVPAAGADTMATFAIGPGRRGIGGASPRGETALLDALSWLPERVATAARRGRPDEFARYLEDLASVTVDVLSSRNPRSGAAPGSDRLTLARAARAGLAAGLGLLEVSAPERLLATRTSDYEIVPCPVLAVRREYRGRPP